MADVVMPQLGETVTEGTVTKWLKAVGETIARDEPLFEVSTDKVDSEVPSPAAGVLSEIRVPEGETVDVGTVLAVVTADGADAGPKDAQPVANESAPAPSLPSEPTFPAPVAAPQPSPPPQAAPAPVVASPPAAVSPTQFSSGAPSGTRAPTVDGDGDRNGASSPSHQANRILSPVVRRLLDEHGLDPSQVPGTGLGGRVTRSDVLGVIDQTREAGVRTSAPTPAVPPSAAAASAVPRADAAAPPTATPPQRAVAGVDEIVPFTNIRRRTAEHMVRSKATSAHTLVVLEADYEQVERVRRSHGASFKAEEGFSLTYLPFVARATVEALHEWPNLNSSVGDDALIVHHQVNLGIAVDLDHQGLIVPVVHRAEELTLRGMARHIRDLADRARGKKLSADDISGGTFSITNAGPFGSLLTAPVINQPQVGILSTDAVKRRPVVVSQDDGTEAIAIHSIGLLCLSWDHRAVDGAYAAAFVARIVELLASHDWSAEL